MNNQKPIFITRAKLDTKISVKNWRHAGLNAIASPLMEFLLIKAEPLIEENYAALIFTSANGIRASEQLGFIENLKNLSVFCVGEKCAKVAKELGYKNVKFANGNVKDLIGLIKKNRTRIQGDILYLCAKNIRYNLQKIIKPTGLFVKHFPIYKMEQTDITNSNIVMSMQKQQDMVIALYSLRAAKNILNLLLKQQNKDNLGYISLICISKRVANIFSELSLKRVLIAKQANDEAMMETALIDK